MLESRHLLSTIQWINRGASDSFNVFGSAADHARAVVDQAINDWESTIQNFNYRNVGQSGWAPLANTFQVTVTTGPLGSGTRGSTSVGLVDGDGKPFGATITLDPTAGGQSWFFDPTPADDEEFTGVADAFTAVAPGFSFADLYRTVEHEMGHAMGLSTTTSLAIWKPGVLNKIGGDPYDTTGTVNLYQFNGATTSTLISSNAAGTNGPGTHIFEGNGTTTFPRTNDLMNAGRSIPPPGFSGMTRQHISPVDEGILTDIYGYTVVDKAYLNSFLATYDPNSSSVILRGDPTNSVGNFLLSPFLGNTLATKINGQVEFFDKALFTNVRVDPGAGINYVSIPATYAGTTTTVVMGTGSATGQGVIELGAPNRKLDDIDGAVVVQGKSGGKGLELRLDDDAGSATGYYTDVYNTFIDRGNAAVVRYTDVNQLTINGGRASHAMLYRVFGTNVGTTLKLNTINGPTNVQVHGNAGPVKITGSGGNQNVTVGDAGDTSSVLGNITVENSTASSTVLIDDAQRTTSSDYLLDGEAMGGKIYQRVVLPTGARLDALTSAVTNLEIHGGKPGSNFEIDRILGTRVKLLGNSGTDSSYLGYTAQDLDGVFTGARNLIFDGAGGFDRAVLLDNKNNTSAIYSVSNGILSRSSMNPIATMNLEYVDIEGGTANDSITVGRSDTSATTGITRVVVNGGASDGDKLEVTDARLNTAETVVVGGNTVDRTAAGTPANTVVYSNMQSLTVRSGTNSDVVQVKATGAPVTSIFTGAGSDNVRVSSSGAAGSGDLNGIFGTLNIDAGQGVNVLSLTDAAANANSVANVYADRVTGLAGTANNAAIFYVATGGSYSRVDIYGSLTGNDAFTVHGTVAGTRTTIYGLGGNDTFNVGHNGSLDALLGVLAISGGGGADRLVVDDHLDSSANTYQQSSSSIIRKSSSQTVEVDYSTIESVKLLQHAAAIAASDSYFSRF